MEDGPTRLTLVDLLGRTVRTVVEGVMEPGGYRSGIDPSALASGGYLLRLETPTSSLTRPLTIRK